jgi:hypothetical protein
MPEVPVPDLVKMQLLIVCLRSHSYTEQEDDDGEDGETVRITLTAINREIVFPKVRRDMPAWSELTSTQKSFYMTEGMSLLDRFNLQHDEGLPVKDGCLHEALAPWGWIPGDDLIVAGLKSYEDLESKNV